MYNRKLKIVIAGLGSRGLMAYGAGVKKFPELYEVVAIAEPQKERREQAKSEFSLTEDQCFETVEQLLEEDKMADAIFLCTQDKQHVPQGIIALKKGYHLLMEKPISPDIKDYGIIQQAVSESGCHVVVCHLLRYTPFYKRIKQLIDEGKIGRIMNVQAIENVGYFHYAHSFVRGNWRRDDETSPMILQKCCHDMDILLWLTGQSCISVSSFGELSFFKNENTPEGASERCLDNCKSKEQCPYDAEKIYLDGKYGLRSGHREWPVDVLAQNPSEEKILSALKDGPYGRCVFQCDNNVVDHQVVNLQLTGGVTVNFTMSAFSADISRGLKVMGTNGEINGDMESGRIYWNQFGKECEDFSILADVDTQGHGGGDVLMVKEFAEFLLSGKEPNSNLTSLEHSLESHYVALGAEQSRLFGGAVVTLKDDKHGKEGMG